MPFIDFAEVKASHTMFEVAAMLGIVLDKEPTTYRGDCPCHPSKDAKKRKFVITPTKGEHGAFYCSVANRGGFDCIALAAHVLNVGMKEAAEQIATHFGTSKVEGKGKSTVPVPTEPESARGSSTKKAQLLAVLERLEPEHMAVDALNFATDFALKHGIGYCTKGTMREHVLVPFRDADGTLLGFIGIPPDAEIKLPADFTPNVVPLHKTA